MMSISEQIKEFLQLMQNEAAEASYDRAYQILTLAWLEINRLQHELRKHTP